MTAVRREHTGNAVATTLASQLLAGATTFTIADATGWPTGAVGPFVVTIGAGTASEERILCLSRTTTTVTVSSRGFESTSDQLHAADSTAVHTFSATEADEANIAAVAVVAATGGLVGVTQSQTLTNKTLTSPVINTPTGDVATKTGSQTLTNKTLTAPLLTAPTATGDLSGFGEAWTSFTPTLTNVTTGNGTLTAAYRQIGKRVDFRIHLLFGSTTAFTGTVLSSLPVNPKATVQQAAAALGFDSSASQVYSFAGAINVNSNLVHLCCSAGVVTNLIPFTWAVGDYFAITGSYEAA